MATSESARVSVLQIAPQGPAGGVADYARVLATRLQVDHGIAVTTGPAEALAGERAQGGPSALVVQYVGYAYARRGAPVGLVRGVRRWRMRSPRAQVVVVFHEVYAFGPPWRSSFWLSPAQRWVARRLLHMSDEVLTPLPLYARMLRRWRPGVTITVLPMFSTVGEPESVPPLCDREPCMAVFGGAGTRARAYGSHRRQLEGCCASLGVANICDVGPRLDALPGAIGGAKVTALGTLPPNAVSALLCRCRAGFTAYPPALLGKSTVFAAYASHGVLPVVAWGCAEPDDVAVRGRHYLLAADIDARTDLAAASAVARQAHAWYAEHSLPHHAAALSPALRAEPTV